MSSNPGRPEIILVMITVTMIIIVIIVIRMTKRKKTMMMKNIDSQHIYIYYFFSHPIPLPPHHTLFFGFFRGKPAISRGKKKPRYISSVASFSEQMQLFKYQPAVKFSLGWIGGKGFLILGTMGTQNLHF